jgi:signal transduction histidine kinase
MYPLSRDKGLDLQMAFGEGEAYVIADPMRLRQVLLNLVSNAIKFTRVGEIVVSIRETTLEHAPGWSISVSDTGPGISPDFLPHVFERFTQEDRLYNETQRGTGLGLSVSRELVTRMRGTIDVVSTLEEGSTFTVTLPRAETEQASQSMHPAVYERVYRTPERA